MFLHLVLAILLIALCMLDSYSQLQSTVNDSATQSDMRTTAGMDSSELADTSGFAL